MLRISPRHAEHDDTAGPFARGDGCEGYQNGVAQPELRPRWSRRPGHRNLAPGLLQDGSVLAIDPHGLDVAIQLRCGRQDLFRGLPVIEGDRGFQLAGKELGVQERAVLKLALGFAVA